MAEEFNTDDYKRIANTKYDLIIRQDQSKLGIDQNQVSLLVPEADFSLLHAAMGQLVGEAALFPKSLSQAQLMYGLGRLYIFQNSEHGKNFAQSVSKRVNEKIADLKCDGTNSGIHAYKDAIFKAFEEVLQEE